MARCVEIVIPYAPRPLQREIHDNLKRFNVLVCHRRFGKTVLCINELIRKALQHEGGDGRFAYLSPLYKQSKQVAWDYLKHYTAPIPGRTVNESELRVDLPNGSRIRLHGADDPDALRGIYLDGAILDEYADMSPRVWGEVIRPALSDRKGWAIFIGTPKGRNQFWELLEKAKEDPEWSWAIMKASQTGYVDPDELDSARRQMEANEFDQEFECSFTAAIKGAFYGELLAEAEADGRITRVAYDPALPVHTAWDLGWKDDTAVWFCQLARGEIRIIDYYETSGSTVAEIAKDLQNKPYVYGMHWMPHDSQQQLLAAGGRSILAQFYTLGIKGQLVKKHDPQDGIQAARSILPRCWFDAEKCKYGLEALRQYQREWDADRKVFKKQALHNWASHAADAFRYLAIGFKEEAGEPTDTNVERGPTFNELLEAHDRRQRELMDD